MKAIKYIKNLFISLIVYSIVFSCAYGIIVNRLSDLEYNTISTMYHRMRMVDNTIKSDFYINTGLKVLDRSIIEKQLRGDSITYCLSLSNNVIDMIAQGRDKKFVKDYLNRCNISFDRITNLDTASELYENIVMFNSLYIPEDDYLELFGEQMKTIVEKEEKELKYVGLLNRLYICLIFIGFLVVYYLSLKFIVDKITMVNLKKLKDKILKK